MKILSFLRGKRGATAIEYAMIAGLVSIAMLGALTLLGTDLTAMFQRVLNAFAT